MAARLRSPICGHFATPAEIDFQYWPESQSCHIAFGVTAGTTFAITLKIFDALVAVIPVTEASDRYLRGPFDPERSQFVCIAAAGTMRTGPFIEEIQRIVRTWLGRGRALAGSPP